MANEPTSGREGSRRGDDEAFIEALARGASYRVAGEIRRRSAKTVQRRMADAPFRARVAQRRGELLSEIVGQLADVGQPAIATLVDGLSEGKAIDRQRSANYLLHHLLRLYSVHELEDRLAAVEERLADPDERRASNDDGSEAT